MTRDELVAELERMDAEILWPGDWVETRGLESPCATLTAAGDPSDSIRDLVRLRTMLPRILFWLHAPAAQGSDMPGTLAPADEVQQATRLAELAMRFDGDAWAAAVYARARSHEGWGSGPWWQVEQDLRAEFQGRIRELIIRSVIHEPRVVGPAAPPVVPPSTYELVDELPDADRPAIQPLLDFLTKD